MIDPTGFVYAGVMVVVYALVARLRPGKASEALSAGAKQLASILPTFLAVFGIVGLFEVFVSPATIQNWMGATSGVKSLFVGATVGSVAAGPPPTAFPLAASLLRQGAWMPAVAAFVVAWVMVGIASLPFEAKTFGWRFAILRNSLSFLVAVGIGLVMGWLM